MCILCYTSSPLKIQYIIATYLTSKKVRTTKRIRCPEQITPPYQVPDTIPQALLTAPSVNLRTNCSYKCSYVVKHVILQPSKLLIPMLN